MSDEEPLKPIVLQPGEGGPKRGGASGVDRTDAAAPQPKRERAIWDVFLSAVLIILSLIAFFTGSVIGLLGLAFFGSCDVADCSGDAVTTTGVVLLIVLVLGIAATIGALALRLRAWWIAAVMLGTILLGWFLSYVLSAFGV